MPVFIIHTNLGEDMKITFLAESVLRRKKLISSGLTAS